MSPALSSQSMVAGWAANSLDCLSSPQGSASCELREMRQQLITNRGDLRKMKIAPLPAIDTSSISLATSQIGRLGELLVQYELLRHGIDSSPMTTDKGIDLVAYHHKYKMARTIQVKTNLGPKPGGGKGSPALDWWVDDECPADWYACVDLSERRIWLFERTQFSESAQQHSGNRHHLYIYTQPGTKAFANNGLPKFSQFLFANNVNIFTSAKSVHNAK